MKTRFYSNTGLASSVLGFGCSSYWANDGFPEIDAVRLVEEALDYGITAFDTGASYGNGRAEARLGVTLRGKPRQDLLISTKCGTWIGPRGQYKDFSPAAISLSVEKSLKRLGIDYIDILYLHGPTIEQMTDTVFEALDRLKSTGKIRATGINSLEEKVLCWAKTSPVDGVMLRYNVLHQDLRMLIEDLHKAGKFIVNGASVGQALYTPSTWLPTSRRNLWYLIRTLKNHRKELWEARHFGFLNHLPGISAPQIALRFAMRRPEISCALFGTTQMHHLAQNVEALSIEISEIIFERISTAAQRNIWR